VDPKRVSSILHLGDFYFTWEKPDKAIETYKKATEADSKNVLGRARIAEVDLNQNKYDQASGVIEEILKINPKSNEGNLLKGRLLLAKREYNEAITILGISKRKPEISSRALFLGSRPPGE